MIPVKTRPPYVDDLGVCWGWLLCCGLATWSGNCEIASAVVKIVVGVVEAHRGADP